MPPYQALADRLLAGLTHRAIAVSESTRDFLVRRRHVPASRVRLIWNGAPLDEFAPVAAETARAARAELGIDTAAPVVGAVARLSPQKGHRYLLDAAARVLRVRPEARFLLAGDGDQEAALRRQAAELGIAAAVVFAGHRSDVPALLGAMDVVCISSTYEGTPLSLFEAMASAKAIVATAVDGCREVLEHGVSALLVPPREPMPLAEALLRVLGDPALRASLAAGARAASRRYDVGACVRQMEGLYDEALAEVPAWH
jgi:glycosyltransferase involved in cell wall biosynthesis